MAAEPAKKEPAKAESNVQPIKKKKGKLPLIIGVAVVLIGGGVGAWMAFKPTAEDPKTAAAAKPDAPKVAPIYYKFDPAFVVNFGGEGSARYLQVTVEVMSRDQPVLDLVKNNEPAVRNDLVLLYSSQDNTSLMTAEGKEKLRSATLDSIRKVVTAEGGDSKLIEAVYFTSFVIQ